MELKQELKLKQTLSQKMIQSANILQMGQIELKEYIEEMALENPVVDLEEREPENGRLEENGENFPALTARTRPIIRMRKKRRGD